MPQYSIRTYMHYDVRPSDFWTSTIEYTIADEVESAAVDNLVDDLVAGYVEILLGTVIIDRVVISTWVPDSTPYDPEAVRTISVGLNGGRGFVLTEPVADDLTLFIRKDVTSGRTGKFSLRGTILNAQVDSESGEWTIISTDVDDFEGFVEAFWNGASSYNPPQLIGLVLLDTTYPAVAAGVKQVPVKVYSADPIVRDSTGFTLVGPRTRQVHQ